MKHLYGLLFILLFCFFNFNCHSNDKEISQKAHENYFKGAPEIDHSDPINLIKSFWAYETWRDSVIVGHEPDTTTYYFAIFSTDFKKYSFNEFFNEKKGLTCFRQKNQIDKVETQGDLMTIVYTKQLLSSEADAKYKDFKYSLVKQNNKWYIDNYYKKCVICEGTGKERDYSYSSIVSYKDCHYCNGLGWQNYLRN